MEKLNQVLEEAGIAASWQGALTKIGLKLAAKFAPELFVLLERMAIAGAAALLRRMKDALMPDDSPDVALDIVRGIERKHGENGEEEVWTSAFRREMAAEAIRRWAMKQGASPDDALVNQLLEGAVGRLRAEQAAANQRLSAVQ